MPAIWPCVRAISPACAPISPISCAAFSRFCSFAAHYYRVGYRPNKGQPNPLPQLTIKGRWLEALGFTTGQKMEVIPEAGQLIIRLAAEG